MKKKNPEDYKKFYNFKISEEKINFNRLKVNNLAIKHFRNAFIFGFIVELILINTNICKLI